MFGYHGATEFASSMRFIDCFLFFFTRSHAAGSGHFLSPLLLPFHLSSFLSFFTLASSLLFSTKSALRVFTLPCPPFLSFSFFLVFVFFVSRFCFVHSIECPISFRLVSFSNFRNDRVCCRFAYLRQVPSILYIMTTTGCPLTWEQFMCDNQSAEQSISRTIPRINT